MQNTWWYKQLVDNVVSIAILISVLFSSLLLTYAFSSRIAHPHAPIYWSLRTGAIGWVQPEAFLGRTPQVHDEITHIDGIPVQQARYFPNYAVGDVTQIDVRSADETYSSQFVLQKPTTEIKINRALPLITAGGFLAIGAMVAIFARSILSNFLFVLFALAHSNVLSTGGISSIGPIWSVRFFNLLLWLMVPLYIHFHLNFPRSIFQRRSKAIIWGLYGFAIVMSLPELSFNPTILRSAMPSLYQFRLYWGIAGVIVAMGLMLLNYFRNTSQQNRQKLHIVASGIIFALVGFLASSIIPDAVFGLPVAYNFSILFLLLIPLAYAYAILQHRLIKIERYISRATAFLLVVFILICLYSIFYFVMLNMLQNIALQPTTIMVFTIFCVSVSLPLYPLLTRLINRLFYGSWYDYRTAVQDISASLPLNDLQELRLARQFAHRIKSIMHFDHVDMLLPMGEGHWQTINDKHGMERLIISIKSCLVAYLKGAQGSCTTQQLQQILTATDNLSLSEKTLLMRPIQLWIPLPANDEIFGVLCVGERRGGDMIESRDIEILETLARQIGPSLQNIWLYNSLQKRAGEIILLHQKIEVTREEERQRLARDLHDQVIQDLVGLNYNISSLREFLPTSYHADLLQIRDAVNIIMEDLRSVCAELRPPILDDLGLLSAIRAQLRTLEEETNAMVELQAQESNWYDLPEDAALCLYRVAQEALTNIRKHADATHVSVTLEVVSQEFHSVVRMIIQDDGCGFLLPQTLGSLMHDEHFGLVGIRERVQAFEGDLVINTNPGQGTELEISVPIEAVEALHLKKGV